jgi:hypothetical protein
VPIPGFFIGEGKSNAVALRTIATAESVIVAGCEDGEKTMKPLVGRAG